MYLNTYWFPRSLVAQRRLRYRCKWSANVHSLWRACCFDWVWSWIHGESAAADFAASTGISHQGLQCHRDGISFEAANLPTPCSSTSGSSVLASLDRLGSEGRSCTCRLWLRRIFFSYMQHKGADRSARVNLREIPFHEQTIAFGEHVHFLLPSCSFLLAYLHVF